MTTTTATDLELLRDLNQAYLDSVRTGDVERFRAAAGRRLPVLDAGRRDCSTRRSSSRAPPARGRSSGSPAKTSASASSATSRSSTRRPSTPSITGQDGRGRYTDDWQKRNGTWVCVSAHVTRL